MKGSAQLAAPRRKAIGHAEDASPAVCGRATRSSAQAVCGVQLDPGAEPPGTLPVLCHAVPCRDIVGTAAVPPCWPGDAAALRGEDSVWPRPRTGGSSSSHHHLTHLWAQCHWCQGWSAGAHPGTCSQQGSATPGTKQHPAPRTGEGFYHFPIISRFSSFKIFSNFSARKGLHPHLDPANLHRWFHVSRTAGNEHSDPGRNLTTCSGFTWQSFGSGGA